MRLAAIGFAALLFLSLAALYPGSNSRAITGKVTYTGTPAKPKIIDTPKQPECAKLNPGGLATEDVVSGPGNTLQNVVVYILQAIPTCSASGHASPL